MTYYLLLPGDTTEDLSFDEHSLGEISFNKYWPGPALNALMKISETQPEILELCVIYNDAGKKLTVEEFLKKVEKLHVEKR